jgi:hypothetical protein
MGVSFINKKSPREEAKIEIFDFVLPNHSGAKFSSIKTKQ